MFFCFFLSYHKVTCLDANSKDIVGPYAEGVRSLPIAEQIIPKSYSFAPETEFTPLMSA